MRIDYTRRFEKTKEIVTEECLKLFETLYRCIPSPAEFRITMSAWSKETGETAESKTSVVIPKPINNYKTMGRLTGKIRDHQVSVINDGAGHFRVTIDGKEYPRLPQRLVEEELGIPVQKKKSGAQSGYPSEPTGRAVWRRLTDRYNLLDKTVSYFDEFVFIERRSQVRNHQEKQKERTSPDSPSS